MSSNSSKPDILIPRPAILVEDVVIFEGGRSRPLTEGEKKLHDLGIDFTVQPGSGKPTRLIGDPMSERDND